MFKTLVSFLCNNELVGTRLPTEKLLIATNYVYKRVDIMFVNAFWCDIC